MATIKDIAREAGVSHGTVSNVLNSRGNVSSEKILLVQEAANKLGYTMNRRAKILREGSSKTLAALLPNLYDRNYVDFFLSFKHYAESAGYSVNLYLSHDIVQHEVTQIESIKSEMDAGLATFSCQPPSKTNIYKDIGLTEKQVVFIDREQDFPCNYIGFDYYQAGLDLGKKAINKKYKRVALVTGSQKFSLHRQFSKGFLSATENSHCHVTHIETDFQHCNQHFLQLLGSSEAFDAFFISNYNLAKCFSNLLYTFYPALEDTIYTLSPLFTMPEKTFQKYELNYRLMGKMAAEKLINNLNSADNKCFHKILKNTGLRNWISDVKPASIAKEITILTLDSPTARISKDLARLYSDTTNVKVNFSICSYDEIYEILSTKSDLSAYDVIRLDHTWLSWFGKKIFFPLKELDPEIEKVFNTFIPGLEAKYSLVEDTLYALPETPNAQLLFYRKDLFEDTILQRLYKEQYNCQLVPPRDFKSFNRIASFFTKKYNDLSPVTYGTNLTLGNSGVAATEYLTRYFSHTNDLFSPNGELLLTSELGILAMNELIELQDYVPSQINEWWRATARDFAQGHTAMAIVFPNYASELVSVDSKIHNNIGFAPIPGGNPLLGGASIGVCKDSKNKVEALDFIKWLCSEEISTAKSLLGSLSPCKETYENYEVMDTYPWLPLSKDNIKESETNRIPSTLKDNFDERKFLSIIGRAVTHVYNGSMNAQQALSLAVETYNKSFR